MATWWSTAEGTCADCGTTVRGPRLVGDVCPPCAETPANYVLLEQEAYNGQRYAVRVKLAPKPAPRPEAVMRGRAMERRARAEADLRWLYQQADGDLGLRAIRLETDVMAAYSFAMAREQGTWGVWKVKPTRTVIVRGLTTGQLLAAHRCRRVTRVLRTLPHQHARVLQRRFELVYYPDLEVPFGEWAGVVDYCSPEVATLCRPREGKGPDPQLVMRYLDVAKQAYALAIGAYMRAV